MAMDEQFRAGLPSDAIIDKDEESWDLRVKTVDHTKEWLHTLSPQRISEVEWILRVETADDPSWEHNGPWNWEKYFDYAKRQGTYATFFNIHGFVHMTGIGVDVYSPLTSTSNCSVPRVSWNKVIPFDCAGLLCTMIFSSPSMMQRQNQQR